jgi:hypothetical protein
MMPTNYSEQTMKVLSELREDILYCIQNQCPLSEKYPEQLRIDIDNDVKLVNIKIKAFTDTTLTNIGNQIIASFRAEFVLSVRKNDGTYDAVLDRIRETTAMRMDSEVNSIVESKQNQYANEILNRIKRGDHMLHIHRLSAKEADITLEAYGIKNKDKLTKYIKKHTKSISYYRELMDSHFTQKDKFKNDWNMISVEFPTRSTRGKLEKHSYEEHIEKLKDDMTKYHLHDLSSDHKSLLFIIALEIAYGDKKMNIMTMTKEDRYKVLSSVAKTFLPDDVCRVIVPKGKFKEHWVDELTTHLSEKMKQYIDDELSSLYSSDDNYYFVRSVFFWDDGCSYGGEFGKETTEVEEDIEAEEAEEVAEASASSSD